MSDNLTFDKLIETIERATVSTQWYATQDSVPVDKAFIISARDGWPELWIVHPSMLESLAQQVGAYVRLRHIRDWKPNPTTLLPILEIKLPERDDRVFWSRRSWRG